jgi:hypothetical protein
LVTGSHGPPGQPRISAQVSVVVNPGSVGKFAFQRTPAVHVTIARPGAFALEACDVAGPRGGTFLGMQHITRGLLMI